mmetsp:Transcript_106776/g.340954  ORF Transcript_106776/g.340954 Transcript_106776/m.340954 type:complete len:177 (-) Transcript_106776:102-632(-)
MAPLPPSGGWRGPPSTPCTRSSHTPCTPSVSWPEVATRYHHLRGDGEVLKEARELLNTLLEALDSRFDPSRYAGSEAATSALAMDETWCLVAPLAERSWQLRQVQDGGPLCPSEVSVPSEGSHPWWSPKSWRRAADDDNGMPTEMDSATAAMDAASAALATASALGSDEDATGFGR